LFKTISKNSLIHSVVHDQIGKVERDLATLDNFLRQEDVSSSSDSEDENNLELADVRALLDQDVPDQMSNADGEDEEKLLLAEMQQELELEIANRYK
jgi:hypothetical protein